MLNRKIFLVISISLLIVEVIIERCFADGFVRAYLGDVLIAVLIYSVVKVFVNVQPLKLAIYVLVFCYTVEFFQWIDILNVLGIEKTKFTSILLGHTYSHIDLLCYTIGVIVIFIIDNWIISKRA